MEYAHWLQSTKHGKRKGRKKQSVEPVPLLQECITWMSLTNAFGGDPPWGYGLRNMILEAFLSVQRGRVEANCPILGFLRTIPEMRISEASTYLSTIGPQRDPDRICYTCQRNSRIGYAQLPFLISFIASGIQKGSWRTAGTHTPYWHILYCIGLLTFGLQRDRSRGSCAVSPLLGENVVVILGTKMLVVVVVRRLGLSVSKR